MSTAPILFSALPSSLDGTQSLSFHELSTSCQVQQLKSPPNSSFNLSSTNELLPPRKTIAFQPSSNSLGSTIITISGRDGRNGLLVWSTLAGKPTPSQRLIPPGRVIVIALSHSATYLATGSADGVIMLWELSTGTLLATWEAHYKAITCLVFSDDDAALVSASEDSMCSVWSIPTLIDESFDSNLSHTPYSLFSDHTLPITDVFISRGTFPDLRIFTASLDQTIKVWSPLYQSSNLLSTFLVPGPAHHLVVDPLERFAIVSYLTPINHSETTPQAGNPSDASLPGNNAHTSSLTVIPFFVRPTHAASQGGISRVHASAGLVQQSETEKEAVTYTSPRSTKITAMHLPSPIVASSVLLCGLSNGKIVHLSIPSLQPLGQTVPNPNSSESVNPVVCISAFPRPPDLSLNASSDSSSDFTGSNASSISARPIGVLGRVVGKSGNGQRTNESLPGVGAQSSCLNLTTMLKIESSLTYKENQDDDPFSLPGSDIGINRFSSEDYSSSSSYTPGSNNLNPSAVRASQTSSMEDKVRTQAELIDRLSAESAKLKSQLNQALSLNETMWTSIVDGTLKFKPTHLPS